MLSRVAMWSHILLLLSRTGGDIFLPWHVFFKKINGRWYIQMVCLEMLPPSVDWDHNTPSSKILCCCIPYNGSLIPHFFISWWTLSCQWSLAPWAGCFWVSQQLLWVSCVRHSSNMAQPSQYCVSKSSTLTTMPNWPWPVSSAVVRCSFYWIVLLINATNTVLVIRVQLTNQLLGGCSGFSTIPYNTRNTTNWIFWSPLSHLMHYT